MKPFLRRLLDTLLILLVLSSPFGGQNSLSRMERALVAIVGGFDVFF